MSYSDTEQDLELDKVQAAGADAEGHYSSLTLSLYRDGKLDLVFGNIVAAHLKACDACMKRFNGTFR